jgi:ligand-binding sensor domain-containing protein
MRRPLWLLLAALPAVVVAGFAAFIFMRAQHSLDRAGVAVAWEGRFPFEMRPVGHMENPGFEAIASAATYTSGAFYRGNLFVSGPSGLFVYGARGGSATLLKSYRVGLDLPAAPLGRMVVGRLRGDSAPGLIIATSGAGVLFFSGNDGVNRTDESGRSDGSGSFRQLLPEDAGARDVTALLPLPSGELLIGTRRRGLLVYPGQTGSNALESFHPRLAGLAISALAADATGFWVGTQDHGVLHCHGGEIDSFEAASGTTDGVSPAKLSSAVLPDEHVEAIAVHGSRVFVGTPMGVEEFDDGRPARTLASNLFVHALYADGKSVTIGTIGSMDEGVRQVSLETGHRPGTPLRGFAGLGQEASGPAEQFLSVGDNGEMYAVMRDGLRRQQSGLWSDVAMDSTTLTQNAGNAAMLTDGNISALAFGPDGRLWVGYFDRGLDILSASGQRTSHLEDDHLFCVNRIVLDPRRRTMAVATANGLVLFDQQNKPRQVMTRKDGLIADHVNDIAFRGESMVVATPAGLTFVDAGGAQSLYAFQGLVNNHVYALGVQRWDDRNQSDEVLAGTLGGVSDLVHESIRRNLTVSNSGLKHNWVTAIVPVSGAESESDWMVGTYGAGVMRLDKDGGFTAMEGVTREMVVNPNAMLATEMHVFVGTLGQGMWVWSRVTSRWRQITAGLPSENVTAFAEHSGEVYVGTENGLVRIAERLLD